MSPGRVSVGEEGVGHSMYIGRLTKALSRRLKKDRRALPISTNLSSKRLMV